MQDLAQRITAVRPDLVNSNATFGELAWIWGKGHACDGGMVGEAGSWTQLNERDLIEVPDPVLPDGFRFRTADEAGPEAAVQAHVDAWAPSTYTAEGYEGRPEDDFLPRRPPRPGGGAGRDHGRIDDHVAGRGQQDRRVRACRDASRLPAPWPRHRNAAARDASRASGRGHSHDGRLPGCTRASERARGESPDDTHAPQAVPESGKESIGRMARTRHWPG